MIADARLCALASRGSDLARLTTPPLGPTLEQPSAFGAGAQHAGHDVAQQLGAVGSAGLHSMNVNRATGAGECGR